MSLVSPRRALISVSNKDGLGTLAKALHDHNIQIISTGGTFKAIDDLGIPVTEISEYTGHPEILGGRVKTLHPKVHGGILALRSDAKHEAEMQENHIEAIDLVVVNLYPFDQTLAQNPSFEEAIEQIDIGGPTMLRSAAKNHAYVTTITDPSQYDDLISELTQNKGAIDAAFRKKCAQRVFEITAMYDASISHFFQRDLSELPTQYALGLQEKQRMRYGENPHQRSSFFLSASKLGSSMMDHVLQGKALSYNNLMDVHAAVDLMLDVAKDHTVGIFKHTNPCGVARSETSLSDAYRMALACDRTSAFGGIVIFSHEVDEKTASECTQIFTEIVIAPGFTEKARNVFAKKKNLRLLQIDLEQAPSLMDGYDIKRILDGYLLQDRDRSIEDLKRCKVVTERKPTQRDYNAMDLSWRVAKHVKSNAIVLTDDVKTLGIGAGQMSRVDSTKIALSRIDGQKHPIMALGSDAFFPFRDSIDLIAQHGVSCVVQPGGSIRDEEVIQAANEHNMCMIFTNTRHFKH